MPSIRSDITDGISVKRRTLKDRISQHRIMRSGRMCLCSFVLSVVFAPACIGPLPGADENVTMAAALAMLAGSVALPPTGTAAITNVRSGGILESNYLTGTSSEGVVEVSLNNGSYSLASLTTGTNWKFALPVGSSGLRAGSVHTAEVRSLGGTPATIAFRKGTNRDLNGDGYDDLVIGAPSASRVSVYYGKASGLAGTLTASGGDLLLSSTVGDQYGATIGFGDENGDGYADLIVGAPSHNTNMGRAYLYRGSATGLTAMSAASADSIITSATASDSFGQAALICDVNGDGYGDVVVSASTGTGNGEVRVFASSASGLVASISAAASTTAITGEGTNQSFGQPTACGADVNYDGYEDLSAGAGTFGTDQGRVYVYHGSASGLTSGNALTQAATALTGLTVTERLTSVAFGYPQSDNFADLAMGAPAFGGNPAKGYFAAGSTTGISGTFGAEFSEESLSSGLGAAVAWGDLNGDGRDDLILGATSLSRVYVKYSTGSFSNAAVSGFDAVFQAENASDQLGSALRAADLNGDGYYDLIMAAPNYSTALGRVYIFYGSESGVGSGSIAVSGAATIITGDVGSGLFGRLR